MSAGAALLCAVASGVLLERDDPVPSRRHAVATGPAARSVAPAAVGSASVGTSTSGSLGAPVVLSPAGRAAPEGVGDVLRQDQTLASAELAAWIVDRALDPRARYAALRRLEQDDPAAAVTAALAVLTDTTPLVRLNAIALLARARDPRAAPALDSLDDRSRRLASLLARRSS